MHNSGEFSGSDKLRAKCLQYENFSMETQNLFQMENYDGFRAEITKAITKTLQTSYSLMLGTSNFRGYSYQFGPTFHSFDGRTIVLGRVNDEGIVSGRISHSINDNIDARVSVNSSLIDENKNISEVSLDYNGSKSSYSIKFAYQGMYLLNGSFSQLITNSLQLGGDLTLVTANNTSIMSVGLRFKRGKNVFFNQITRQPDFSSPLKMLSNVHSLKSTFFRKISERLSLATEFEMSIPVYESALRFGYEYLFKTARIQGVIDTSGKISLLCQDSKGFGVSGAIDYVKDDYKFGFMMQFTPQDKNDDLSQ
ncbi:mitochondrial import receptor subunit tom40 [Cryptosporidium ryanae]|uniref:mitochondrial import receptor subunit tom40 n=1 Tax=Cryptosporidium ryanae TaxID=515981 RepID=UPI00351A5DCF|nr:mitochondrial import receptor subunit tom40 [Cryptosporidium ryanae]